MAKKGYVNTIFGGQFCQDKVLIVFSDQDLENVNLPHTDPLVIKLQIGDTVVSRVLVDVGSSSNILLQDTFRRMGIEKEEIQLVKTSLHAFNRVEVKSLGVIVLLVYTVDRIVEIKFLVVDTPLAMYVIKRREWIHAVKGHGINIAPSNKVSISKWSLHHRHQRRSITEPKMLQHRKQRKRSPKDDKSPD